MRDLTQGSVSRHILAMAAPIAFGMIFQTLYYVVDLYFVARIGDAAVAGVSAGGNAMILVFALTQMLGVGTLALISHAVGRRDQAEANLIFNQSLVLSALCGLITLIIGFAGSRAYMSAIAADAETIEAGVSYLYWFMPGMALQFAMVAMGSALRGTGIVRPSMVVQIVTVILNVIFAPILIAGWGTGKPMGVAGAGLASSLAIFIAVAMLAIYFVRLEKYVAFHREQWRPRFATWRRMLAVGLPAGGELMLMFASMAVVYWCIRDFGAAAQAGYGIGSRIMQAILLPSMAVAFAAGPIAGQNFGARNPERVRETFRQAVLIGSAILAVMTILSHWRPEMLVGAFASDPAVLDVAVTFFRIMSWNFIAQGLVFTCSSMFQGLGDTRPALLSSMTRILVFTVPAIWLSTQPDFRLEQMWYLSVFSVFVHAGISALLLNMQFRRRLPTLMPAAA